MTPIRDKIIDKLGELPEYSLREVLDFVEFLSWKASNNGQNGSGSNDDPLLAVLGILQGKPITNEEIDKELYGSYFGEEKSGDK